MSDPSTFWENYTPSGAVSNGSISLANGWSSGPTSALSEYVLGIRPVRPGFDSWSVSPHPGALHWAKGQVPTPHGPIAVRWRRRHGHLWLQVSVPRGTSGTVSVPASSAAAVRVNGRPAWGAGRARGYGAQRLGSDVVLHGLTGAAVVTAG